MRKRILVVEDDASVRDYVAAALEGAGRELDVVGAANGREAVALLGAGPFDLVLTDLDMPVMNGVELVEHLRTHAPSVRIVVMSGSSGSAAAGAEGGALDDLPFLAKPVSVARLVAVVCALVEA
jgi:CheY-like chemotaxis protein